jgi:hypothetical protein
MIAALLAAIHDLSSSSSLRERSPSAQEMASGVPTPSVPTVTKTASAIAC